MGLLESSRNINRDTSKRKIKKKLKALREVSTKYDNEISRLCVILKYYDAPKPEHEWSSGKIVINPEIKSSR